MRVGHESILFTRPPACVGEGEESILFIFIAINSISCWDLSSMARVFPASQRDQRHEMWNIFPKRPNIFESRRKFAQNKLKWRHWPQKPGGVNRGGRKEARRPAPDPKHWPHSKYWVIPPRNKTHLIVPSGKKAPGVWIQPDFDSLYIDNPRDSILDELPK